MGAIAGKDQRCVFELDTLAWGWPVDYRKPVRRLRSFVDREAVRLGDKGHPLLIYGDSDLDVLLSSCLDGGGFVLVCPHCARLGGVEPDELRKGFKMATPQSIAGLSMNVDTVISY